MNTPTGQEPRWDWTTMLVIVLAVIILLVVTFELWVPHFGTHR
ncbi:MAG TPA: hypothetical protein VNI78_00785 [Vicinamibacterales bacterium]|nr:hypothetical protein [Vicinamibacterales bacterium]